MKKCWFALYLAIAILIANTVPCWAAYQSIEAEGFYCMGDNDTRTQGKEWAWKDAKRMALEKAGTYLKSSTQVVNGQVTKDEITAVASGMIKLERMIKEEFSLENNGKSQVVRVKGVFSIDFGDLEKKIEELKKNEQGQEAIRQLADLQARYNQLLGENKNLKDQIAQAKTPQQMAKLATKEKQVQNSLNASQWLEKGIEAYNNRDYNSALEAFDQVVLLDPGYAKAYYYRGITYHNLKFYQQALSDYNKCLSLMPRNADTYNNRAILYSDQGNWQNSLLDYTKAISLNNKNPYYYSNRGNLYSNQKRYGEALLDYNLAIQLNPRVSYFYFNRGGVYANLGETEKARGDYRKAIALGLQSELIASIPPEYR